MDNDASTDSFLHYENIFDEDERDLRFNLLQAKF
jgi:hypothetical protein